METNGAKIIKQSFFRSASFSFKTETETETENENERQMQIESSGTQTEAMQQLHTCQNLVNAIFWNYAVYPRSEVLSLPRLRPISIVYCNYIFYF